MGKSKIKDKWLREKQEQENIERGRHSGTMTEKPRKSVSAFIQKIIGNIKPFWMAKNNGHRRNSQNKVKVSGIIRSKLKEKMRRELY